MGKMGKTFKKSFWKKAGFDVDKLNEAYIKAMTKDQKSIFNKVKNKKRVVEAMADVLNDYPVHFETDYYDDLIGISPNRVNGILVSQSDEKAWKYLVALMRVANRVVEQGSKIIESAKDTDGAINWDFIFSMAHPFDPDRLICGLITFALRVHMTDYSQEIGCPNNIIEEFLEDKVETDSLLDIADYISNKENLISIIEYVNRVEEESFAKMIFQNVIKAIEPKDHLWIEKIKRVPSSEIMRRVDPRFFKVQFLAVIEKMFGSKQIASLSTMDQMLAALTIWSLHVFDSEEFACQLSRFIFSSSKFDDGLIISKILDGHSEAAIQFGTTMMRLFQNKRDIFDGLTSKENARSPIANSIFRSIEVLGLTWRDFAEIYKYYDCNVSDFLFALDELANTASIAPEEERKFPIEKFSVTSGRYVGRFGETGRLAAVAGIYTDCCQAPARAGASCCLDSLLGSSAVFAVVNRRGEIVMQSWIWMHTNPENDRDIVVFDSIEYPGSISAELQVSKDAIQCYTLAIKELLKKGCDVAISLNGNRNANDFIERIKSNLSARKKISAKYLDFFQDIDDDKDYMHPYCNNIYTDVKEGVKVLYVAKTDKKKKRRK